MDSCGLDSLRTSSSIWVCIHLIEMFIPFLMIDIAGFLIEAVSSYMADTSTLLFIFLAASATRETILFLTA